MTAGIGHNGMSRDEWLYEILRSGNVTRIAQHLALVIYHMSDPSTNQAKLSARDLERITGWGRTAIIEHIDELEIFIRVTWGAGRAKALFELQGVIAEAVDAIRYGRQPTATADTRISVRKPDTTADTTAAINSECPPAGHNNTVHNNLVSASRTQHSNGGDYRGGILDSESSHHHHQGSGLLDDVPVPGFRINPDGSFNGTAFERFSATEIASMRAAYPALDIFPELINADAYLASEFEKDGTPFGSLDRRARLHLFLSKKQRDAHERIVVAQEAAREKARPSPDDGCRFDSEGRLVVANGFRAELLALVGHDENKLRINLDKCAAKIGIDMRGSVLMKNVRAGFTKEVEWAANDERKVQAIERRGAPIDKARQMMRRY